MLGGFLRIAQPRAFDPLPASKEAARTAPPTITVTTCPPGGNLHPLPTASRGWTGSGNLLVLTEGPEAQRGEGVSLK